LLATNRPNPPICYGVDFIALSAEAFGRILRAKFFFAGYAVSDHWARTRNVVFLHQPVGFLRRVSLVNQRVAFFRIRDAKFI
jgi:hypothetical protein